MATTVTTKALPKPLSNISSRRISSIDAVRGIVMVIMAIDHTREFWGATAFRPEDISQASPALFLTRLVTHICAPTFIFLSGVSIYLRYKKHPEHIRQFLLTRGLWLIFFELVVMSPIITHGYTITILGIFWVIGASMIIMAAVIALPRVWLVAISSTMIAGHNLLAPRQPATLVETVLGLFHNTPFVIPTEPAILVAYTIVPWVGVMMLGYCLGTWYDLTAKTRKRNFLLLSVCLLMLFFIFRGINTYGDLFPWTVQQRGVVYTICSFFNLTKYPPSLLLLALTLSGCCFLLAWTENARGRAVDFLVTFGKVPFFFFILHFSLLSLGSALWATFVLGDYVNFSISPPTTWPELYQPDLLRVYLIWIIVIFFCYFPCRWFASVKERSTAWWLAYL